jgi:tetratricopeptide (TPR) repeat protein
MSFAARSASPVLTWARRKVRDRAYAGRMVKAAAKNLDVSAPRPLRKALARWIRSDLAELLCDPTPDRTVARLLELAEQEHVELAPIGDLREFVFELSDGLLAELPPALVPQSIGRMIRSSYTAAARNASDLDMSLLPSATEALLRTRLETDPDEVCSLVDLFHTNGTVDPGAGGRLAAADELTSRWQWWQWAAVGLFADAHRQQDSAAKAFSQAVALGAPEPDAWRAHAALTKATHLADVDTSEIDDADLCALFDVFRDIEHLDLTTLPPLPDTGADQTSKLARSLHASAHMVAGDFSAAITILNDSVAANPGSLATQLRLAEAHLHAAKAGDLGKVMHLERARRIAIDVRDAARRRHLPLRRQAVSVACQAALMVEDWPAVFDLGLTPPDGTADEHEAADEETMATVVGSALLVGRIDVVERLLPDLPPGHAPLLYRAHIAQQGGDSDASDAHLRAAWEEVTDWGRAVTVLLAWARQLDDPLPPLAMKGLDAEQADRHQAMAEILRLARTSPSNALARLRSYADANRHLGINLVWLVESAIDRSAAMATAEQILGGRDDPEVHEYLARSLLQTQPQQVDKAIEHALSFARGSAGTALEPRARRLLAALYETAGDRPAEYRGELRWLAGAGDEAAVWALMGVALHDGETDTVAGLLDTPDLRPEDRSQVGVYLRALIATGRHDEAATAALHALDDFEDDDDFCAGILAFVHATGGRRIQDDAVGDALRVATEDFLSRAPDHPAFHAISTDDMESVVNMLGEQLANRRRVLTIGRWRVRTGRLPLGMLAATVGVDYVEMSIDRASFSRGHHPSPEGHAGEIEAAIAALDGSVIVDTTAIATATAAGLWPTVRGAFQDLAVTEPAIADIVRAAEMQEFRGGESIQADAAGQLVHYESDAAELDRRAERIAEVVRAARTCRSLPFSSASVLPELSTAPRTDPWISAIEIAHHTGLPLLCDDFSTRTLAASVGVKCFSLYAILDALAASDRLDDPSEAERHRRALLQSGSIGLPMTEERAGSADLPTTLWLLSDGTAWLGADTLAQRTMERALADAISGSRDQDMANILALSLVGVAEQALFTRRNPVEICGALTALAVGNHARTTDQAAALVTALDRALMEWLLHPGAAPQMTAKALSDLILEGPTVDPDTVLTYVMSRLGGLPMEARQEAAGVLLGAVAPPINAEITPDIEFG